MRKSTVYIFLFCFFLIPQITSAHPGRTDSSGGHYCRTNCEKWGLKNGQYHFHNGGNDNASDNDELGYDPQAEYDRGYQKGYETAYKYASKCQEYQWEWNGTQDYGNGFEDGINQGHADGSKICEDNSYAAGKESGKMMYNETDPSKTVNIPSGYDADSYRAGIFDGWTEMQANKPSTKTIETSTNDTKSLETATEDTSSTEEQIKSGYGPVVVWGGILLTSLIWSFVYIYKKPKK